MNHFRYRKSNAPIWTGDWGTFSLGWAAGKGGSGVGHGDLADIGDATIGITLAIGNGKEIEVAGA